MGSLFAKLFTGFGKKEVRILMVGLDAAGTIPLPPWAFLTPSIGKTTVLYKLKVRPGPPSPLFAS